MDDDRGAYEVAQNDYGAAKVVLVPSNDMTVRELLVLAVRALPCPDDWQLTQLPSHLLLYREVDAEYPRMTRLWPPRD
ncbi:MAG: hypothetical protein Q8K99_13475 [Actinomycetota bacterium]|nr:hypothetical protein [Actinomycetota bacterium]